MLSPNLCSNINQLRCYHHPPLTTFICPPYFLIMHAVHCFSWQIKTLQTFSSPLNNPTCNIACSIKNRLSNKGAIQKPFKIGIGRFRILENTFLCMTVMLTIYFNLIYLTWNIWKQVFCCFTVESPKNSWKNMVQRIRRARKCAGKKMSWARNDFMYIAIYKKKNRTQQFLKVITQPCRIRHCLRKFAVLKNFRYVLKIRIKSNF